MMKGDRIAFTRNDRTLARENGARAGVIAVNRAERSAQGRTATRAMIHAYSSHQSGRSKGDVCVVIEGDEIGSNLHC